MAAEESDIESSPEYKKFRASISKKKALLPNTHQQWVYFQAGPKSEVAIVCLHGTSGTADMFFHQVMSLSARGYHVISAQFPPYWTHKAWIEGFAGFLRVMGLKQVHLFGVSLGGFLCLHFAAEHPEIVVSLALCNAFCDTLPFVQSSWVLKSFGYLPEFFLKKYLLDSFPKESVCPQAVDFAVGQLDQLSREDLGSRLTLNCLKSRVGDVRVDPKSITIIDAHDEIALPDSMRERLYRKFPEAKLALIKDGGDFPMLSNPHEISMHLQVHLRANGYFPPDMSEQARREEKTPEDRAWNAPLDGAAAIQVDHAIAVQGAAAVNIVGCFEIEQDEL